MYNKFKISGDDSKGSNKKTIFIIGGVVVLAIIIGILIAVFIPKGDPGATSDDGGNSSVGPTSEEEAKITKETLEKYVEVKIDGYKKSENNPVSKDVVAVSVKNISDKTISVAVEIGAFDGDDNMLETSSLYAEGLRSGDTQPFELFAYTQMTPDQMQKVTYKVYKAWTYTPEGATYDEETTTIEEPVSEPETEAPVENNTTETENPTSEGETATNNEETENQNN